MKQLNSRRDSSAFFYWLMLPTVLVIAILTIYPLIRVFTLSFYKYNFISDTPTYIGTKNYATITHDALFWQSLKNTLVFSMLATFFEVFFGTVLAIVFQRKFKHKQLFMTLIIFPMMLSTMVICAIWRVMYHYDIGLFNYLLTALSMQKVGWLISPDQALYSIVYVDIWQWTPFCFLLAQAAMSSIDEYLYEAAAIDGATFSQSLRKITLPLIRPQIYLLITLRIIDTFKLYGKVYALTMGGPGNATETLSFYIYREGFSYFNLGRSSTASILTLVIVSLIASLSVRQSLKDI
ncbi:MAG: sugar ABC transporter permease [Spirochaetia bacterium]|jgi:multiple sugar transport system permease protein|nr:sugar ABC transporter permease [Spirochaetia bacterium]